MNRRCIEFQIPGLPEGTLALPIQRVVAISAPLAITRVPLTPAYISGICEWGNQVMPVLDLAWLLGVTSAHEPGTALLLARMILNQKEALVAWWTHAGAHQVDLPPQLPLEDAAISSPLVYGIGRYSDHRVILLDIDQLSSEIKPPYPSSRTIEK